jgi:hypothetical protein
VYALAGLAAATAVSLFVWVPQMPFSVVLGWVAGVLPVWLYTRGAGVPRGRGTHAAVVAGALAGALIVSLGGEFGYVLRTVAAELDLALGDLVFDFENWRYVLIPTFLAPETWLILHVGGVIFAVAAVVGLVQALVYTKRWDRKDRADAADATEQATRVRDLVRAIVEQLDPVEREPLLAQAATIHSVSVRGAMFDFEVDAGSPPSPRSQSPLAVSAEVVDGDGDGKGGGVILVWLREPGHLARLEFVSSDGRPLDPLPQPSLVRMRHADSW